MRKKYFLIIILFLMWEVGHAQKVEIISYDFMAKTNKSVFTEDGDLIHVGISEDGLPMVVKMDTTGGIIWQKVFDNPDVLRREGPFDNYFVHFDNVILDSAENLYLFTERLKDPLYPYIVKLGSDGELIWVSEELRGVGNTYEHDFDSWMFAGETKLTVVTGYSITMNVDLSTGEYLGIDPVLSNHYMNVSAPEMVYDGKHYRKTTDGFLMFDSYGNYIFEPDEAYIPFNVWHVDDFGYYSDTIFSVPKPGKVNYAIGLLNKMDTSGRVTDTLLLKTGSNYDGTSEYVLIVPQGFNRHPIKGIIVYGYTRVEEPGENYREYGWIAQISEDNFEVKYDTLLDLRSHFRRKTEVLTFGNSIFVQSSDGIRPYVLKLNLKDVQVSSPEKEIPEEKRAKVYPNPSNTGEFIIQAESEIQQVEIFTTAGQLIYVTQSNALLQTVQLHSKGIYILRVKTSDNRIENHKIVNR